VARPTRSVESAFVQTYCILRDRAHRETPWWDGGEGVGSRKGEESTLFGSKELTQQ
jgi:hypothetical protein